MPVSFDSVCLKDYFISVKTRSIQEPVTLKQVFFFIKFERLLLLRKFDNADSVGSILKSPLSNNCHICYK